MFHCNIKPHYCESYTLKRTSESHQYCRFHVIFWLWNIRNQRPRNLVLSKICSLTHRSAEILTECIFCYANRHCSKYYRCSIGLWLSGANYIALGRFFYFSVLKFWKEIPWIRYAVPCSFMVKYLWAEKKYIKS